MAFFRRILFKGESWILTPQAQQKTGDAYVAGFRFSKHFCFCRFVFCWHELWKGLVMHLILLGDLHARMVRGKRDRDSGTSVIPWEPVLALSLSLSLSFSPSLSLRFLRLSCVFLQAGLGGWPSFHSLSLSSLRHIYSSVGSPVCPSLLAHSSIWSLKKQCFCLLGLPTAHYPSTCLCNH